MYLLPGANPGDLTRILVGLATATSNNTAIANTSMSNSSSGSYSSNSRSRTSGVSQSPPAVSRSTEHTTAPPAAAGAVAAGGGPFFSGSSLTSTAVPPAAWSAAVLSEVSGRLPRLTPLQLSDVLWALGSLGLRPGGELVTRVVSEALDKMSAMNGGQLARLAAGLAQLGKVSSRMGRGLVCLGNLMAVGVGSAMSMSLLRSCKESCYIKLHNLNAKCVITHILLKSLLQPGLVILVISKHTSSCASPTSKRWLLWLSLTRCSCCCYYVCFRGVFKTVLYCCCTCGCCIAVVLAFTDVC